MDYVTPLLDKSTLEKPRVIHWLNVFGNLETTKERIQFVLDLNSSAFRPDCAFAHDVTTLCQQGTIVDLSSAMIHNTPPKETLKSSLNKYLLQKTPSSHHIIFQNEQVGGSPIHPDNQIDTMTLGVHASFHLLLKQKNLLPHQQLTRLLGPESPIIDRDFFEELIALQNAYHEEFTQNPFAIYKPECFVPQFVKNFK